MSDGSKPESIGQQAIGALADLNLATGGVGLAAFVECHHDERRAVSPDDSCLAKEVLFAFLQADRVDDRLALDALQARFEHRPLRAVDHERQPRDLWLHRNDVQERSHRRLRVEHSFVHVDVEDVRAAANLLEGNRGRIEVLLVRDHAGETLRSGDVGPLADDDQRRVGTHGQRLQPGEVRQVIGLGSRVHALWLTRASRRHPIDRFADRPDVRGRRPAAASKDVHDNRSPRSRGEGQRCAPAARRTRRRHWADPRSDGR